MADQGYGEPQPKTMAKMAKTGKGIMPSPVNSSGINGQNQSYINSQTDPTAIMKTAVNAIPLMKQAVKASAKVAGIAAPLSTNPEDVAHGQAADIWNDYLNTLQPMLQGPTAKSLANQGFNMIYNAILADNPPPSLSDVQAALGLQSPVAQQNSANNGSTTPAPSLVYPAKGMRMKGEPAKLVMINPYTKRMQPGKPGKSVKSPEQPAINSGLQIASSLFSGMQTTINNSLIIPLNNILRSVGEEPIPAQATKTAMKLHKGGSLMSAVGGMQMVKRPGKPRPCTSMCPYGREHASDGSCRCVPAQTSAPTQQEQMTAMSNNVMTQIAGIQKGIATLANHLPCPPCASGPMQEGGTRRSRMKKSKKTLRNRRS